MHTRHLGGYGNISAGGSLPVLMSFRNLHPPFLTSVFLGLVILGAISTPPVSGTKGAGHQTMAILGNQVQSRQAQLAYKAGIRQIEMTTSISFVRSLEGSNDSTLSFLLESFVRKLSGIPDTPTNAGLNRIHAEMGAISREFRKELRAQVHPGHGNMSAIRRVAREAIKENAQLCELEATYWNTRLEAELAIFDAWIRHGDQLIAKMEAEGCNITHLEKTLVSIRSLRGDLASSLEDRDGERITRVQREIVSLSKNYMNEIHKSGNIPMK